MMWTEARIIVGNDGHVYRNCQKSQRVFLELLKGFHIPNKQCPFRKAVIGDIRTVEAS